MNLKTPLDLPQISALRIGDVVSITGMIITARDAAHKYLLSTKNCTGIPELRGSILYHCGPVIIPDGKGGWKVTAAGPTTSIREEPYEADVIRKFGIRAIIGKGGMGERTAAACRECGCIYLSAVGGAAQVLANAVSSVRSVHKLEEFGAPEAFWELDVTSFPAIVTIDVTGNNLHENVQQDSFRRLEAMQSCSVSHHG